MYLSLLLTGSVLLTTALATPVSEPSIDPVLNVVGSALESFASSPNEPEYWYSSVKHNGISPFTPNGTAWPVFRNVKSMFGAKGDGVQDDTEALQNAINAGNSYAARNESRLGTTLQPAVVYLPKGTYVLTTPIQLFVGMILMGDPTDPPTIKASAGFSGDYMIYAKDPSQGSTTNFYVGMKNVVIDSQAVDKDNSLTLVDWSVSQACQLANVRFDMPYDSAGHTGIAMPEGGSGLIMEDLYFHGGVVGIELNNQQYHFKSLTFDGCTTAILVRHMFMTHCQGCNFTLCGIGVDMTRPAEGESIEGMGSFIITDSVVANTGALVNTAAPNGSFASVILENVRVDGSVQSTVTAAGEIVLRGGVGNDEAWVWGNTYRRGGPEAGSFERGAKLATSRPASLVDGSGAYYRFAPPTYAEYTADQIVNVKDVAGFPVAGDGRADDTASLQAIIDQGAAAGKVLFFPYGVYLVTDTLVFPPGSRVFGEAWPAISATGSKFINAAAPVPMVKVGNRGDVGVAQFSEMLFTVEDVLPGCTLLEVNMAGENPGDVGFWNTHFRVGGANDSQTTGKCTTGDPADCKAAFMLAHFTSSSSAYVDDMWAWTADHDLDGSNSQTISVGRGVLIESTRPSWFFGLGSEHNTLYEVNINHARDVFIGFQQSETPYWQGTNSPRLAPDPWSAPAALALPSDPDFAWCGAADAQCRMSVYQGVAASRDLRLYAGGFWTFFGGGEACAPGEDCQRDGVRVDGDSAGIYYLGLGVNRVANLVVRDGEPVVRSADNRGGWSANVAAYLGSV
ncbi:glycoside hydrolase family 55 protein [Biscogniauxia marginata]|nr:glycoside hydrolase family 55 protein [Biscogniauxia marginata]